MILVDRRKLIPLIAFILVLFGLLLVSRNYSYPKRIIIQGPAMGTQYKIVIKSDQNIDSSRIKNNVESILSDINNQMSTYQLDSEISEFNFADSENKLKGINISDYFLEVIDRSFYYYNLSSFKIHTHVTFTQEPLCILLI